MKTLISLLIPLIIFSSPTTFAGGDHVENGGDTVSIEFVQTGRELLMAIAGMDSHKEDRVSLDLFKRIFKSVKVTSENGLFLEGREVDAINSPTAKTIRINRARWSEIGRQKNSRTKYTLVLHEYFGVMGYDDTSYSLSSEYVRLILHSQASKRDRDINFMKLVYQSQKGDCTIGDFWIEPGQTEKVERVSCHNENLDITFKKLETKPNTLNRSYEVSVQKVPNGNRHSVTYSSLNNCWLNSRADCADTGWISIEPFKFSLQHRGRD